MGYEERGFIISADLGQSNDFTAITIIERIMRPPKGWTEFYQSDLLVEYHLRHIERPERGTPYPKVTERLYELRCSPELRDSIIVIDLTGVGRPVYDFMRNNGFPRYDRDLWGIQITGGNTVNHDEKNHYIINVPKRDLISALQLSFQNKDLKIAKGIPNADILVKELTNFKVKINLNGHDQYEAWREGIHDDIVLSAAMGVWWGSNPRRQIR